MRVQLEGVILVGLVISYRQP